MVDTGIVVAPGFGAAALAAVLAGIALGTASGLVPGLHANNFALLMAAAAADLPGRPTLLAAAMLAAGVVHTFLDAVPALALGVPDAAMAATALPGHRLVIAGRGREAVRLSALGSGLAVALAVPLALPVTALMTRVYPAVESHLPVVLATVATALVATEPGGRARLGGLLGLAGSGALGVATLDLSPAAPLAAGGVLTPLFAGLFGAPLLLEAAGGGGVPEQDDPAVAAPRAAVAGTALVGAVGGALVGYLPGVSAAVAAVLAFALVPGGVGDRGYVVAVSGVNTSNAIFALFALVALGNPRTGVLVAVEEVGAPTNLPLYLVAVALAAVAGFALVLLVGDRYLRVVGRADYRRVSAVVLALLAGLSYLFAGPLGVGLFLVATLVGLVPPKLGARRVNLMGVLLVPLALS
jgi:putative membrane protein